jgi:hypothetical protein
MIDHKTKSIFVHVTGAGGTSVEVALCGRNWWHIEPHTKHLPASGLKNLYADYWGEYFKFAFVRSPYERTASLFHRFGERSGEPFSEFIHSVKPISHFLDEEIDYVGKLENVTEVWETICYRLGLDIKLPRVGVSVDRKSVMDYFASVVNSDMLQFESVHKNDNIKYDYPSLF